MRFFRKTFTSKKLRLKRAVLRSPVRFCFLSGFIVCLVSVFVARCRRPAPIGPHDVCIPEALYINDREHCRTSVVFRNFQAKLDGERVGGNHQVLIHIELFKDAWGDSLKEPFGEKTIRVGFDRIESPVWTSISPFNALLRTALCTAVRAQLREQGTLQTEPESTPTPKAYRIAFATADRSDRPFDAFTHTTVPSWVSRPEPMVPFSKTFSDPFDWALASQEIRDLDLSEEVLGEAPFLHPKGSKVQKHS